MKPDELQSSLLAQFRSSLQKTAVTCSQTRSILKRLLEKECRAEGVSQIKDRDVWRAATSLYHMGFLAQREWLCNLLEALFETRKAVLVQALLLPQG